MTVQVGSWRRSFFLASIAVRNSPCNFKRNVDRSAEKREQQYDLFKRHGASPLSALKHSGENEIPNGKIRSYPATQGTGKEHSRLRLWAQRLMGSFAAATDSLP